MRKAQFYFIGQKILLDGTAPVRKGVSSGLIVPQVNNSPNFVALFTRFPIFDGKDVICVK